MDWRRIPSLSALRAFEAAARLGSFTKAAAELNVTQAAITQHVRALEEDLSESLTERDGRGVALTAQGRNLADSLTSGFSTIEEGITQIRQTAETRPITLSTTPGFATNWLMPRMGDFWARHPEISVSLTPSLEVVDLRRDGFDLAIRYGDGTWTGVDAELLTDGSFWVVGHPDLLEARTATCLADVENYPWVFEANMLERRRLIEGHGVDFDKAKIHMVNTNTLVLAAVRSGLGLSIQSKSLVAADVHTGALTLICELYQAGMGYYLLSLPGRTTHGQKTFRRWLKDQAREAAEP